MKIVFDTEACEKNHKDVDVMLYLLSLAAGHKITTDTFEKARISNYLKFNQMYDRNKPFPDYVELTDTGEFLIEGIMADSHVGNNDDRFTALADKLRELYPAGKKPGYAYTWRDSTSCIADRLKKFFLKYGDHYSDEDIIRVTKEYVDSFNGNYKYMQLLKYFIWKNKVTGEELVRGRIVGEVERQSQLAAYLQDNDEEKAVEADWDVELR